MRFILKLFAAPVMLVLIIVSAVLAFVHAASAIIISIASGIIFLGAVILFIVGEPLGGAAFLVVAFLASPYGLHALAGKLADLLGRGCNKSPWRNRIELKKSH